MDIAYFWCSVLEDVSETIVALVTEKGDLRIEYLPLLAISWICTL